MKLVNKQIMKLVNKQIKENMVVSLVYLENYDRLEGKGYEVATIENGDVVIVGLYESYEEALKIVDEVVAKNQPKKVKAKTTISNPEVKKMLIPVMYDTFRYYDDEDEDLPQFEICVEATTNTCDDDDNNVYVNVFVNIDGELSDHDYEVAICPDFEVAEKYIARTKNYLAKDKEIGKFVR